ncbi:MAG: MFS transporter [Polyangia bacterium]
MKLNRALIPIFLIVLVDIFGLTLVIPLLAIYAESLHATPLVATLLVSVFAVCQLVSGPLLGQLSDRVGRKPVLILSQLGTLVGFIILARASSLWLVFLSRIIDGATAGNLSIAQAYIADNTRPEDRTKSFALIGIAFGLGFFIGPWVTGYLAGYGLGAPIYLAALMSLLSVVCTLTLLPGGKPPQDTGAARPNQGAGDAPPLPAGKRLSVFEWSSYSQYVQRPVLGGLLLQFLCFALSFATFTAGFALFAERRLTWNGHPFTPREVGYLFGYSGFLGLIWQGGLITRLVRRFGEARLTAAGFLAVAISSTALGLVYRVPMLVVIATIASFGNGVLRPVLSSLVSQQAAAHEQGVVLGLTQSLQSLASIVAPPLAGFLIEHGRLGPWAWVSAAAALLGLVAARWGSAQVRPRPAAAAAGITPGPRDSRPR